MNKLNKLKKVSISLALLSCFAVTSKIGAIEEQIVATGHSDGTIKLWDINKPDGQENICNIDVIDFRTSYKNIDVKLDPFNTNRLAACNKESNDIQIWDISGRDNPILVDTLTGHTNKVACITFNTFDENILASGSEDNTIKIWDLSKQGNKCINTITFDPANNTIFPTVLLFSPFDRNTLVAGSNGRDIKIWDTYKKNNAQGKTIDSVGGFCISLEFNDKNTLMALKSCSNAPNGVTFRKIIDLSKEINNEPSNLTWESSISLNPFEKDVFASGSKSSDKIYFSNFITDKEIKSPIKIDTSTMLLKFSPFKENILIAATRQTYNEKCKIEVLDLSLKGKDVIKTIDIPNSLVTSIDFMKIEESKEAKEFKKKLLAPKAKKYSDVRIKTTTIEELKNKREEIAEEINNLLDQTPAPKDFFSKFRELKNKLEQIDAQLK